MSIVSKAASAYNICSQETHFAIRDILKKFNLPDSTIYSAAMLYEAALSDKKRSGGTVNLIVPEKIGHCSIRPTLTEELQDFIEAGL